jgi:hypothetical protein
MDLSNVAPITSSGTLMTIFRMDRTLATDLSKYSRLCAAYMAMLIIYQPNQLCVSVRRKVPMLPFH